MAYLYISTTVFLFGAQLDALIRNQATGTLSGVEPPSPRADRDRDGRSPPVPVTTGCEGDRGAAERAAKPALEGRRKG
jgi:hypothetical protein